MTRALLACLLAGCGSASLGVERAIDAGADTGASAVPDSAAEPDTAEPDTAAPDTAAPPPDASAPADVMLVPDLLNGASFRMIWTIQWFGSPTKVSCAEASTPTVVLTMRDAMNRTTEDHVPCEQMMGQTRQLPSGLYNFKIAIEDERGQELGYSSQDIDLPPGRSTDLGDRGFELQSFQLGWTLQRAGKPATCAATGARSVELVATLGAEPPVTYSFPCADGKGTTKGIRQGHYQVVMRLIGADGKPLVQNPAVPVEAGDERRATVPPVTFVVP